MKGSAIRPRNATIDPVTPNQRLPSTIEALPMFGPGRNWHKPTVSAKSAGVSQRRSSTIVRCAHGITPPNERAPMARNPVNSSYRLRGGVTSIFSCTIPHMRALLAALFFSSSAALACEPALEGVRLESARYSLAYQLPQVKVSEHFALEVAACAKSGAAPETLTVDAQMPEHRHGMNYRPT